MQSELESKAKSKNNATKFKYFSLGSLSCLILASLLVILVASWPGPRWASPVSPAPSNMNVTDTEQLLKEKLDNYGKRADDLQKLISILLGLTTIYAIVLAVSAYSSVQDNLKRVEKEIDRLEEVIADDEEMLAKNRDIATQMQREIREAIDYSTRISIGRLVTFFPFEGSKEELKTFRHQVIKRLVETRTGRYLKDPYLSLLISRSYKLLELYQSAEDVMTTFIAEKEQAKETDDDLRDAYYNRACYQGLRWDGATEETKTELEGGIERDLIRAFSLDESLRGDARIDPDFTNVLPTDWFKRLVKL